MSAVFTVHAFMSIVGILASRLARLQPPLGDGASLPLHVPAISHLFTLPQTPSPFSFQQGSLRDGKALAPFSVFLCAFFLCSAEGTGLHGALAMCVQERSTDH